MPADAHVAAVRRFNRFYTRQIGVLDEGHLQSPFSLAEVRMLYELAHRGGATASELGRDLGLDRGYVSRIVRAFARHGLIVRTPDRNDKRQTTLSLSAKGRRVFAPLNRRASEGVARMLAPLTSPQQTRLLRAMRTIENLLRAPRR